MTEYEKMSLALMSSIAQGISLQMTQLDSIQPPRGMAAGHDYDTIARFAADRVTWQKAAARLAKLVAAGQV